MAFRTAAGFAMMVAVGISGVARGEAIVTKVAETFDEATWTPSSYSRVPGSVATDEPAPGADGKSVRIEARYGAEFGTYVLEPKQPLVVPGNAKRVTIRHRISDPRAFLLVNFRDGWEREKVGGKSLEWQLKPGKDGAWTTSTFDVPADWVQPIRIASITCHNWETKSEPSTVRAWVDQLEVTTDIGPVDPQTSEHKGWSPEPSPAEPDKAVKNSPRTPLVVATFGTLAEANAFQDEEPVATATIRNWRPGALSGRIDARVLDSDGNVIGTQQHAVSVESSVTLRLPLPAPRLGHYRLEADFKADDGLSKRAAISYVTLAPRRALTEREKLDSPYGLNIHGAAYWPLEPYKKAGMVWFREYAFHWDWMEQARGDGDFAGWPYPHAMVKRIQDAGLHIMPVLQKSISPPKIEGGKVASTGPTAEWKAMLASIVEGFPTVTHWELANEYGLNPATAHAEDLCDWRNYGEYHRAFAEVIAEAGEGKVVAVENGQAGIWPGRIRSQIERGYFDKLGVVNTHHYTGVEPPEVNYGNFNTGFDTMDRQASLFFDDLRNTSRAADSDGKDREHWFTEFGWDTKAGRVVTMEQQAHYLPRAWMLLLAAGVDKGFWFYHLDSQSSDNFFDGCGMIDKDGQPKPALAALAGLTARLPSPTYVGDINAGPGTQGYVFEQDGKLVAALWSIHDNPAAPTVTLDAERLYDVAGNPIEGPSVMLTTAPVYAEGLSGRSPWVRQTAYSIDSDHLVVAAAGDAVTPVIKVENRRDVAIDATIHLKLPDGWRAEQVEKRVSVSPGESVRVEMPYIVSTDEPLGAPEVAFLFHEGGADEVPVKELVQKLLVQPALAVQVSSLSGRAGDAEVTIKVANKSSRARDARLDLLLPASWKAATTVVDLGRLAPGDVRDVPVKLNWSDEIDAGEEAMVRVTSGEGRSLIKSIIPSAYRLHEIGGVTLDGTFNDWPEAAKMPAWMLGSTMGGTDADVYLAWSVKGLYVGVDVRESKTLVSDPRTFWTGESLELWIDTADDKTSRKFGPRDHQFWFTPLIEEGRVYTGRWNRDQQLPGNQYDLRRVAGASRKTPGGYAMEFLLPAELLEGYSPAAGGRLGLNVNLCVKGPRYDREVYWSRAKVDRIADPGGWGSVELVE